MARPSRDDALRRSLAVRGLALMDDLRQRREAEESVLTDDEAMDLAVLEVRAQRAERHSAR